MAMQNEIDSDTFHASSWTEQVQTQIDWIAGRPDHII